MHLPLPQYSPAAHPLSEVHFFAQNGPVAGVSTRTDPAGLHDGGG